MCRSISVFFLQIDFCGMDVRMSPQNSDIFFRDLIIIKSATFKEVEENNFVLPRVGMWDRIKENLKKVGIEF